MTLIHALQQPVGRGQPNADDDVLNIKQIFERIGRLSRPDHGPTPFFDAPLEGAIRGFQKDRSLMIDGRMKPGGETERNLQRDLGLLPKEPPFSLSELDITGPVANGREGNGADLRGVSKALGQLGLFEFDRTAEPLPFITKGLEDGIRKFQQREGLAVDGRILPRGETIGALKLTMARTMAARTTAAEGESPAREPSPGRHAPRRKTPAVQLAQAGGRDRAGERRALERSLGGMKRKAENTRVSRAQQSMHDRADQFGRSGLTEAEAHLRHYLSGDGTPIRYTREKARTFRSVRAAENDLRERFEKGTFLGKKADGEPPQPLRDIKDGETIHFKHRQTGKSGHIDFARNVAGFDRNSALAFGKTGIVGEGDFIATRKGDTIEITGSVTHNWTDNYDFHGGQPGSTDAKILEEKKIARQYAFGGTWRQTVRATVKIVNGKPVVRKTEWTDLDE